MTKSGMKKDWSGCLIMRLADTPTVMTFAAFSRHREAIAAEIGRAWKWEAMSPLDLADLAIRAVAKAEEPPR